MCIFIFTYSCSFYHPTAFHLFSGKTSFSYVETYNVTPSIREGSHVLLHQPWHEEDHSKRLSWTALERDWKRVRNLRKHIEWVLLTNFYGNSSFFLANRAQRGSRKITFKWFYRIKSVQISFPKKNAHFSKHTSSTRCRVLDQNRSKKGRGAAHCRGRSPGRRVWPPTWEGHNFLHHLN